MDKRQTKLVVPTKRIGGIILSMSEDIRSRLDKLKSMRPDQVIPGPLPKDVPVVVSSNVDRKTSFIKVRCTDNQLREYKAKAKKEGLNYSAWVIKRLSL